jgi:precorrin-2/cobalt-factor-2 C20-methyltransferase
VSGTLHIVGVGPGDPELMTLKAARVLAEARRVAFFAKAGRPGHARTVVEDRLAAGVEEIRFDYPFTTEVALDDPRYLQDMGGFYDGCAQALGARLAAGEDMVLICEGDPFFYGSSMYLYDRLRGEYAVEVTPGVTGMSACWTRAGAPMVHGDDVLCVLPGTLEEDALTARLGACDAAVIMKVGSNLTKIGRALERAGRRDQALYVERGCMAGERVAPLSTLGDARAPYFSVVLVPGRRGAR